MIGGGMVFTIQEYDAVPLKTIKCFTKDGLPHELEVSPAVEIRFVYLNTHNKKKKVVFYFDRIFVTDSTVTGIQSRFIPSIKKTIPLNRVIKIEVQNGGKNFHYIK